MVNNPRRVPPTLEQIDPHQEGAPRLIHPIGADPIRVGTPLPLQEIVTMDRPEEFYEVKESKIVQSRDGKTSIQVAAGTRIPKHQAYEYGLLEEPVNVLARGKGEQLAVADDTPVVFAPQDAASPADVVTTSASELSSTTPQAESLIAPAPIEPVAPVEETTTVPTTTSTRKKAGRPETPEQGAAAPETPEGAGPAIETPGDAGHAPETPADGTAAPDNR